jgi:hypothetical protein
VQSGGRRFPWESAWSPGGRTIYYEMGAGIVARDLGTGQERQIRPDEAADGTPRGPTGRSYLQERALDEDPIGCREDQFTVQGVGRREVDRERRSSPMGMSSALDRRQSARADGLTMAVPSTLSTL